MTVTGGGGLYTKRGVPVKIRLFFVHRMSILQRISRLSVFNTSVRSFTTSSTAFSETAATTTKTKPKGLYQFFENNQTLPKQVWTGKT